MTARVVDVAEHILAREGEMSAMKLHKLVYYCQAWHLAWSGVPLFNEEIHAWANGPAIPALYELHKGVFTVGPGFFYEKLREQKVTRDKASAQRICARRTIAALASLMTVAVLIVRARHRRRS